MRARSCTLLLALAATLFAAAPAPADVTGAGSLRLAQIGSFASPTYVTGPSGDPSRVVVVEQGGTIRMVRNGAVLPAPFLTVAGVHNAGEQGLLSLAFAPDYATSGRLYVYSNDATSCDASGANCDVRIDEYRSAGVGADAVDPATRRLVLRVSHRKYPNHDGGQLQFGPDGFLYAGFGDGGSGGDPDGNGQNRDVLLGKLVRIDPRPGGAAAYTSPSSNPFFGPAIGADEVWAYGLRNPWRFSFDRLTGDLVIGDVGQNEHEEVDFQPAGFGGGANYGWNLYEGAARYSDPNGPQPSDYVPPVLTYDHVGANCAITGGYVVRDTALPELAGRYLYADECAGVVHSVLVGPGRASNDAAVGDPADGAAPPLTVAQLDSFGEDAACRVYVVSHSGPVYRLASTAPPAGSGGCATLSVVALDRRAPVVTRLRMARRSFAVSRRSTALTARASVRSPQGSAFRFTLSERSTVILRIDRLAPGRRVGKRCVAPTRRLRRRRACTRFLRAGALTRTLPAGRRSIAFSGRIGRRALRVGSYRAVVTAVDAARNVSRARTVTFQIVRG
ncbi:MAG TPA: PQQ-dependent sugar dehydrogenase [Solirubrobacteraceae bacterium]|nr:PQQ-dependent sugar dehydrogenase [Solirubrobacteraceae bacterium]